MILRTPHSVNGKIKGYWITDVARGRKMYLAIRRNSQVFDGMWWIEKSVIRTCQEKGFDYIGVAVRSSGKFGFYASNLDEFLKSPHYTERVKELRYACMPVNSFQIKPLTNEGFIDRNSKLAK